MTRLALLAPETLLGRELKESLERRRDLWTDLRLLTLEPEEEASVSDLDGEAVLVRPLDAEALADVDLLVAPGGSLEGINLEATLPAGVAVLAVSPERPVAGGVPVVTGVAAALPDLDAEARRILVSPRPTVVALALMLDPLRRLGLERAVAFVLEPASDRGQRGLDELLEQSRRILAFHSELPTEVFGRQLAFNLLPDADPAADPDGGAAADLRKLLGGEATVSLATASAGVFHACTLSVHVRLADDPGSEKLAEALSGAPHLSFVQAPTRLSPKEAAGRDDLLLATARPDPAEPGAWWLWGVMDNLTRGGALNALGIVEALFGTAH